MFLIKKVETRITSQTVSTVLVVLPNIWSAAVTKTIIDTEIYGKDFDYFVKHFLEVRKKISQKRAPSLFAKEAPSANDTNQEHHHNDTAQ